ncbi:hypothetical protein NFI96_034419, partial [Prochilodus magdalenae]
DFVSPRVGEMHWIGLNDLETEGKWMWVNNQTLNETGVTFWYKHGNGQAEPDNWKQQDPSGENCASLGMDSGFMDKWFDASCSKLRKYICEKDADMMDEIYVNDDFKFSKPPGHGRGRDSSDHNKGVSCKVLSEQYISSVERLSVQERNASALQSECQKCGLCGEGWKAFVGKCYYFSTDELNWMNSRDYCAGKGGHLVVIISRAEQNFVSSSITENHWIGLNDLETEGKWMWVDKQPLTETIVTWGPQTTYQYLCFLADVLVTFECWWCFHTRGSMRQTLQPTQVAQVVQLFQDGTSMRAVAGRFAVPVNVVSRAWRRYQKMWRRP